MSSLLRVVKSDNAKVQLGNLGASILGLITFMLLTRSLSKEEFGQWAIFMAAVGLLDLLRSGLGRQAMVREMSISDPPFHQKIIGSALMIQLVMVLLISLVIFLLIGLSIVDSSSFLIFLRWYPALLVASLMKEFDTWITQAKGNFGAMVLIRIGVNILFIMIVIAGSFVGFGLNAYIASWVFSNLIISIISQFHTRSLSHLRYFSRSTIRTLIKYGKHSLASMVGTNLLRSSDSLIIGALLGSNAVAVYAIPLKIIDVLEIPVRGFATTSFSKLSRYFDQKHYTLFVEHFVKSTFMLIALFIPVGIILFIFPELPLLLLGGQKYLGETVLIQIFVVAMILIPLDKFLGVSFDCINQPRRNAIKVWLMVLANIIGDVIAIQVIGELWAVALVTVFNIIIGISFSFFTHPLLRNMSRYYQVTLIDLSKQVFSLKGIK